MGLGDCSESNSTSDTALKGQRSAWLCREVKAEIDYLLYLPKDYSDRGEGWPLLVFLHGAGERGSNLELVKMHGPPKLVEEGKDFPFILVSPQCPQGKWWSDYSVEISALIDVTVERHNVDKSRIYLTGLSMGGYGCWSISCKYPEKFAAIAPVCGGGIHFVAENLKDVPVWTFHGAKDEVVPVKESGKMVDAVKASGGDVKYTVYPNANHDSWTETYNNDELYSWLLSHTKKK